MTGWPTYRIVNPVQMIPTAFHEGVWNQVAQECIGLDEYRHVRSVRWFRADSIINETEGIVVYGLTALKPTGIHVYIEKPHWDNPAVWSHEAGHALTLDMTEETAERCEFPSPVPLPVRRFR